MKTEPAYSLTPLFNILLLEDNPAESLLLKIAMEKYNALFNIEVVAKGEDVVNYVKKEVPYTNSITPDLILLDLNVPGMNGIETLNELKEDKQVHSVPVIILTNSSSENDILKSYDLHANCYVTKPADLDEFARILSSLLEFWFTVVQLPHSPDDKYISGKRKIQEIKKEMTLHDSMSLINGEKKYSYGKGF